MKGIRSSLSMILIVCMVASLFLSGCDKKPAQGAIEPAGSEAFVPVEQKTVNLPFSPIKIKAEVKPYAVSPDLSNIENLAQYAELSENQKALLVKNGFFVRPTSEQQLFYIYENNEYKKIPSFITADSVLQMYHIFYDFSLRKLESETLYPTLEEMNGRLLGKSIHNWEKASNPKVKQALLKNAAVFATAQLALEKPLPEALPQEAKKMAEAEYAKIKEENGFQQSSILPFSMDYSQYTPRGHYTRSEELKRYFRAMMWYGQAPFPLYKKDAEGHKVRDVESTLQALLISYAVFQETEGRTDVDSWEKIYSPTAFYVGVADDLTIYDYKGLLNQVYGDAPDIDKLDDAKLLDKLYALADKFPEPAIQAKYTSVDAPVGKQFRVMGQRFIPDSEIIQELVEPIERPIPRGLDVFASIGSQRAETLLKDHYNEPQKWAGYTPALEKMKAKYGKLSEDTWRSNLYYGWLWTLKGFLGEYGTGYPTFMTNQAWQDRSLSSALGSWSELKHDTVLYGKQSGAECGGGEEPPQIKGYVEPNIPVYERLLWLNQFSRENLKLRGIVSESVENKMENFDQLLKFLISCSEKELRNEELSADEYGQLLTYGGMMEYMTASFAGEDGADWYMIASETDKNIAIVSDIHTVAPNPLSDGGYIEVGVGPASEIMVAVPIDGKLYLTRGAVFSYYEFLSKDKRLTDEEWQKRFEENRQPPLQDWMDSFIDKGKLDIPDPAEPYSSGC